MHPRPEGTLKPLGRAPASGPGRGGRGDAWGAQARGRARDLRHAL